MNLVNNAELETRWAWSLGGLVEGRMWFERFIWVSRRSGCLNCRTTVWQRSTQSHPTGARDLCRPISGRPPPLLPVSRSEGARGRIYASPHSEEFLALLGATGATNRVNCTGRRTSSVGVVHPALFVKENRTKKPAAATNWQLPIT